MEKTKLPAQHQFLLDPVYKSSMVLRSADLTASKVKYYDVDLEAQSGSEIEKNLLATAPSKSSRRRRACTLCCCYCFYIIFILLLVLAVVVIKLVPTDPRLSLGELQVTEFVYNDSSSTDGPQIQTSVIFGLNATNRNHHADTIYRAINLTLFYKDESLGNIQFSVQPGFEQKKKMTTPLDGELPKTLTTIRSQPNVSSLKQSVAASNVQVEVRGTVKGTHKVLGLKVKRFDIGVQCKLNVDPGNGGSQAAKEILPHSCYYDA